MESRHFKPNEHDTSDWNDEDDDDVAPALKKVRSDLPHADQKDQPAPLFGELAAEADKKDENKDNGSFPWLASEHEKTSQAEKERVFEGDIDVLEYSDEYSEAEPENLTPEEVAVVVQEHISNRSEVLNEELAGAKPGGPTAAAAHANKKLLEHIEQQLTNHAHSEEPFDIDVSLDDAWSETRHDLDLSEAEKPDNAEPAPNNTSPDHLAISDLPEATPLPASLLSPDGGRGSASEPPAVPPKAPSGGLGGGFTGGNGNFNVYNGSAPNIATSPNFNPAEPRQNEVQTYPNRSGHDFAKGVMVGGIAGYLIGRRRGRINTEQKFVAVTEKLQKEVAELQDKVVQKEQQVRKMAAQKVIAEQAVNTTSKAVEQNATPIKIAELAQPTPAVQKLEHTQQQEAQQKNEKEKPRQERPTQAQQAHNAKLEMLTPLAAERLPKNELLEVAAEVVVGGSTLKRLYEAGTIGESAMRKILVEHVRGGSTQAERQLRLELTIQEQRIAPHEAFATSKASRNSLEHNAKREQATTPPFSSQSMPGSHGNLQNHSAAMQNANKAALLAAKPAQSRARAASIVGIVTTFGFALLVWFLISH